MTDQKHCPQTQSEQAAKLQSKDNGRLRPFVQFEFVFKAGVLKGTPYNDRETSKKRKPP